MTDIKTTKEETPDRQLMEKISSAVDIFDQIDTGELVKSLDKEVDGAWAYEFSMDGKPVSGLSADGASETCRFIAYKSGGQVVIRVIGFEAPVIEEPNCFKASVKAGCYVTGIVNGKPVELLLNTSIGYAKQLKKGTRKDGTTWDIPHAEVLAVVKAERNAKAHLIPPRIKKVVITKALQKGKVAPVDPDGAGEKEGNGNGFISESEYADMFALMQEHKKNANLLLNHCKKHYGYTSLKNIKKDKFKEILEWIKTGESQ